MHHKDSSDSEVEIEDLPDVGTQEIGKEDGT